jgi:hypothetical protein
MGGKADRRVTWAQLGTGARLFRVDPMPMFEWFLPRVPRKLRFLLWWS